MLEFTTIPIRLGVPWVGQTEPDRLGIALWSGVLILFLLAMFVVVMAIRRWLKHDDVSTPHGFSLGDLRALHRQGQLTDDEFELARARMIGSAQRDIERQLQGSVGKLNSDIGRVRDTTADLTAFAARSLEEKAERDRIASASKHQMPGDSPSGPVN